LFDDDLDCRRAVDNIEKEDFAVTACGFQPAQERNLRGRRWIGRKVGNEIRDEFLLEAPDIFKLEFDINIQIPVGNRQWLNRFSAIF